MKKESGSKSTTKNNYQFDPRIAIEHLSNVDSTFAHLIEVAGPFKMEIRAMHSPFEALARNIVYQQLNGTAAAAIHARVLTVFGGRRLRPKDILEASDENLRGAGLSHNKMVALRDLAAKTLDGTVPTLAKLNRMSDEEIIERLT